MKLNLKKFKTSEPQHDEADIYNRFIAFYCDNCHKRLKVPARYFGHSLECPSCNNHSIIPDPSFALGQRLKHYQIDGWLAEGSYGEILVSHDTINGDPVAIKIMKPGSLTEAGVKLFKQEYSILKKFDSPHLCKAYSCGREGVFYYFAMSYIMGESCGALLHRYDQMSEDLVIHIMLQIAETMDMVWTEQKAVHNDIKPDNITITPDGNVVILDWGLSAIIGPTEERDEEETEVKVVGSPLYMCPEKFNAVPADSPASDIYSFAATSFALLTGLPPILGKTVDELREIIANSPTPKAREFNPSVSPELDDFISAMLRPKRSERPQTWAEITKKLKEIAGHEQENNSAD